MSAKDVFHETVKTALVKDGWKITHDPLTLTFGERRAYVDLGAEQPFAAERDNRKIAVEVKSFRGASDLRDYESALGQYIFYRSLLARSEPERKLYLAVPNSAYLTTFTEVIVLPSLEDAAVSVVTFDPTKEVIVKWIN